MSDVYERQESPLSVEARYIVGHVLDVLRSLPDASVDLVLTSPPFLGLRSYLLPDDPNKALEIGAEPTPGEYIDALLDVIEECRRVLAPHGSLVIELGDTYSGSGGSGGDYDEGGMREGQAKWQGTARSARETSSRIPWRANDTAEAERNTALAVHYSDRDAAPRPNRHGRRIRSEDEAAGILAPRRRPGPNDRDNMDGWPLDKSLCLVPELLRFALVYGFNALTGRQTLRWRARNVVRWCRPNPPVGALADKVRPATSDMVIACVGRRRYFDLDAVRTPLTEPGAVKHKSKNHSGANPKSGWDSDNTEIRQNENGAPPLDHWWLDEDAFEQDAWLVSTVPYTGAHFAVWPPKLLERPIEAMCPRRVCTVCGEPSERITEKSPEYAEHIEEKLGRKLAPVGERLNRIEGGRMNAEVLTTGWTDCGHDSWRPGVVLDPFAGSGTTLAVAFGHGRSSIGIELDKRNVDLATERVGMWLQVEHYGAESVA